MNREQLLRAVFEFFWERDRAAIVLISPRPEDNVVLPLRLMSKPQIIIGFAPPVPDFECSAYGLGGGLSFNDPPDIVKCRIPWTSIVGVSGKDQSKNEGVQFQQRQPPKVAPRQRPKFLRRVK